LFFKMSFDFFFFFDCTWSNKPALVNIRK
jgi:hypothetical protein